MKFCNHCGRLYEDKCSCKRDYKKEYKGRPDFYDTKGWKTLSRYIRMRDYNLDRLQLYFQKFEPDNDIEKRIKDVIFDTNNMPRKYGSRLVVHHIYELDNNWNKRYEVDNLITLNYYVHEFIHQLYFENKEAVQKLLLKAVRSELP